MKKITTLMLSIAVLCITSAPVFAGEREGAFSISPFVGGYTFGGVQHLETAPVFGLRLGYDLTKNWGVEAVGDFLATDGTRSERSINSLSYRLDILYNFMLDGPLVPYLAVGGGGITYGHGNDGLKISDRTTDATVNVGGGLKYFITDSVALRGDVRQLFVLESPDSPKYNWEYTAGITFLLGGKQEEVAKPVEQPAPVAEPVPVVAPVPAPPVDSDGDGVTDDLDKCPNTPAGVKVDAYGCPVDSDKDGVADYLDKCPDTPAGAAVDAEGCPLDSDRDGVPDYLDKCPGTPAGVAVDAKGCPLESAKRFCDKPAVIAIAFDTGKAVVKTKYHGDLDKLGNFLKEFPDSKGTIEGHTDSVGSKAANVKLSQARAENVRSYIINKFGIDGNRITAKGYGSAKPVASNKTAAGKAKNRRIEAVFTCK